MGTFAVAPEVGSAVAHEAIQGLTGTPKTLSPWLFYDEAGSRLFEEITVLPEYYLTRTERGILERHADEMVAEASRTKTLTVVELGAGTATKTGLLLAAAVRRQGSVLYQPVDVSESALEEARRNLEAELPGVVVKAQVADYTAEPLALDRPPQSRTLALYIGSSIGNFSPAQAHEVLANLRGQLRPGDGLLLGTDLVKDEATLLAAYDDAAGVTAAFNRNVLVRLNRELGADFRPECFAHKAVWNARESRIEMHLVSATEQRVHLRECGVRVQFRAGETIHTENSYKFTGGMVEAMLSRAGFGPVRVWHDPERLFAVTLAVAE